MGEREDVCLAETFEASYKTSKCWRYDSTPFSSTTSEFHVMEAFLLGASKILVDVALESDILCFRRCTERWWAGAAVTDDVRILLWVVFRVLLLSVTSTCTKLMGSRGGCGDGGGVLFF